MDLEAVSNNIVASPLFAGSGAFMTQVQWEAVPGLINTEQLFLRPASVDEPLKIAELQYAAQVSAESYKLYPCGGYQDGFSKPLSSTRASAHFVAPRSEKLNKAWVNVVDRIGILQNSRRITGTQIKNQICQTLTSSKQEALRLRHELFVVSNKPLVFGTSLTF